MSNHQLAKLPWGKKSSTGNISVSVGLILFPAMNQADYMHNEPIVIIDDDSDDHFIFGEVCQKLKLENELKFFKTAASALNYLRTTQDLPFIIFCDMNMPQMNGIELRRIIDKDEVLKKKSIPFVFFTTAASRSQINEAYDLTVQGFFIKESSFDDTEKVLRLIFEYWQKCKHPKRYQ